MRFPVEIRLSSISIILLSICPGNYANIYSISNRKRSEPKLKGPKAAIDCGQAPRIECS